VFNVCEKKKKGERKKKKRKKEKNLRRGVYEKHVVVQVSLRSRG